MQTSPKQFVDTADPHGHQPVLTAGPAPQDADGIILYIHGRGATASSILSLHTELKLPGLAAIAPQAAGQSWYPHSFLAPIDENQPYLDSALRRIESIIAELLAYGIQSQHIFLIGFSQGACLTAEFIARHPRQYGGAIAFTGGLIGPPGTPRNYPGSLAQTPVFLGSADPDPHVPFERVRETQSVLAAMDAQVDLRRYPGMGHTICEDELEASRDLIRQSISQRSRKAV